MKAKSTLLAVLIFSSTSQGAILLNEPFAQDGTMGATPYATWTSVSGTGAHLVVLSATGLAFGSSDHDYSRAFTSQSGDAFAGFDLRISTLPTTGSEYIAAFADGSGFDGRIFVTSASSGTSFTIGLSIASNTIGASTTTLNLNTTYRIVSRYNPTTDAISLWVGSYAENSPAISVTGTDPSTTTNAFVIRQAGALDNGASTMTLKNLAVATTFAEAVPEPGTALLGAFGSIILLRRRRLG